MQNFFLGLVAGVILTTIVSQLIRFLNLFLPWQRAILSGTPVPFVVILGMRLRGSPVDFLLDAQRTLMHANNPADIRLIESCYIANRHRVAERDMPMFLQMIDEHRQVFEAAEKEQPGKHHGLNH